jgi:hypothetical protein
MAPFLGVGPESLSNFFKSFKKYENQFDLIRPRTGNSLVLHNRLETFDRYCRYFKQTLSRDAVLCSIQISLTIW